ncbi:MAG: acetate--CoA ligase [Miltoncostaeaceae bacterium]
MGEGDPAIDALQHDGATYPPPADVAAGAVVSDPALWTRAADDPISWWEEQARRLEWASPWTRALDDDAPPFFRWFTGGTLNVAANCLDRHLAERSDRVAFHWEGEPGDRMDITYADLHGRVCRFANALRALGVERGGRVAIYMGMVPELPIAMLACARLGAAHTVVFGGFSAEALADRMNDFGATVLVTQDEGWRAGKRIPLKANADAALDRAPRVAHSVVCQRTGGEVAWRDGRDLWFHEVEAAAAAECPAEAMDAEQMLFALYTSGTTGKPKGIVHTSGGYLTGAASTHRMVFDLRDDDVYWCAADIGWITGHSYIVYGPLANGATSVMYEGGPGFPRQDRLWEIAERYRVSILYMAPTAIRTFMKWGDSLPAAHDLSSIRILGSVGEPINPEAWEWYRDHIGGGRAPVMDTWWQTETGSIMISPLPGLSTLKPGSASRPLPGISARVVGEDGREVPAGRGGYLVIDRPWPSMLRTILGDDQRYVDTYWSRFPGMYLAGDGCRVDSGDDYWLLGRIDDVMNVSGHRLSTIEIESALVDHPAVAEAAVVGRADPVTGEAIAAFVTLRDGVTGDEALIADLRDHVARQIGAIAKPASIVLTPDLPKTRSGKIMRRLLRDVSEHRQLGDVTTLANEEVVSAIADLATANPHQED